MERAARSSLDDAVYRKLRVVLERAVARACPPWLASRKEDVVQGALLRLVKKAERRPVDTLPASYVHKIAYSSLVDEIRYQRRRRLDQTDSLESASLGSERLDPESNAVARDLGRAIKACLHALAQTRNLAVSLYLQGSRVPEIARTAGWSQKQADNAVYRGLADMRRCLSGKGVQP